MTKEVSQLSLVPAHRSTARRSIQFAAAVVLTLATVACNKANKEEATAEAEADAQAEQSKPENEKATPATKPAPAAPPQLPAPDDVAAPGEGAETTGTGLKSKVLKAGKGGDHPTAADRVTVHYTGWTADGKMFDSSVTRNKPSTFSLRGVIPGWTEGVQLMTIGEKRRFWIPGKLAYGEKPRRPGAPSGQLTFDIELLEIIAAPKTPEDVAAPSAGSKKTASGLQYKIIKSAAGEGKKPGPTDRVQVHYSGWTKDGKMFDSSVMRGHPASFRLNQVIKGWTEGLQLVKEGEKVRLWIPGELAYGNEKRPGRPSGQLTFDVELIRVLPAAPPRAPRPAVQQTTPAQSSSQQSSSQPAK